MKHEELYDLPVGSIIEQYFHPPKWKGYDEGSWFFEKVDFLHLKVLEIETHSGQVFRIGEELDIRNISKEDVDFIYHGIRNGW